jgi:hypothetical protein
MVEMRLTTVLVSGRFDTDETIGWDSGTEVLGSTFVPAVFEED